MDPIISRVYRNYQTLNEILLCLFEAHKIKNALFSMHSNKSQWSYGMNPEFYQSFRDIIGTEVMMSLKLIYF